MTAPAEPGRPTLVARQPILDASGTVRGHELLFRGARRPDGTIEDGRRATAQVLVATFLELGVAQMAGDVPAWVNVGRDLLLQVHPLPLPADRVVLELLEDADVDDVLLSRLAELRAQGFAIALDDFVWTPRTDPLVDLATYVKLDVRALGLDGLAEAARGLRARGVRVVAEKVETAEERDACLAAGAELLQGWFFARPEAVRGRTAAGGGLGRLRGAAHLARRLSFEEVERAVVTDPGLSVGVLRLLRAASRAMPNRVASVRQALVLLGADAVRQWAMLVALAGVDDSGGAVLESGLLRARICQLLAGARAGGPADPDSAFAVGLLSVLDALTGAPLEEALRELPLEDDVCAALLRRQGPLGELLGRACAAERGEGDDGGVLAPALQWTDALLRDLRGAGGTAPVAA
jgi:EAL and modified HD-GYP domain-containing signal transduction protein